MNKREVVWLIVRLIGVYFAYLAIVSVFTLAGSISTMYSLVSDPSAQKAEIEAVRPPAGFPANRPEMPEVKPVVKLDPATEKLKSDAFKDLLLNILLTVLYGGTAFYLTARGLILFNILARESAAVRRQDDTVTTLRL